MHTHAVYLLAHGGQTRHARGPVQLSFPWHILKNIQQAKKQKHATNRKDVSMLQVCKVFLYNTYFCTQTKGLLFKRLVDRWKIGLARIYGFNWFKAPDRLRNLETYNISVGKCLLYLKNGKACERIFLLKTFSFNLRFKF